MAGILTKLQYSSQARKLKKRCEQLDDALKTAEADKTLDELLALDSEPVGSYNLLHHGREVDQGRDLRPHIPAVSGSGRLMHQLQN